MKSRFRITGRRLTPVLVLGLSILLVASARSAPAVEGETTAAKTAPDTWHATTFVMAGSRLHVIRYWSKGDWMRAETMMGGHPVVTIVRGKEYLAFDALAGTGARIQRAPAAVEEDGTRDRPFGNDLTEIMAEGAEKVEETTRNGLAVEVWRKTDSTGRRKLWVTGEEPILPMRLEVFVRAGSEQIETDYTDWLRGIEIPDSFFEAPSNVKLEELDYPGYLEASSSRSVAPVLYPDLLHGTKRP